VSAFSRGVWLALLLLLGAPPAAATTRRVPADFPDLQDALDASVEGDTVQVAAGAFIGAFVVPGGVVLRGAGADLTTLDGSGAGPVLDCQPPTGSLPTRVEDLRLTGGSATMGALLHARSQARLQVARARLDGGTASVGGGGVHAASGSSLHLTDAEVSGCVAPQGAGLLVLGGALQLTRVKLHDNQASSDGGGVLLLAGSTLGWTDGSCQLNHAQGDGGGVAVSGGVANLGNVTLADNGAEGRGGGVYCGSGSTAVLSYVNVLSNQAGTRGGGVATSCDAASGVTGADAACSLIQLYHCDVLRNQAPVGAIGTAESESRIEAIYSILADHPSGLVCLSPLARLVVSCSLLYGNGTNLSGSCPDTSGTGWVTEDPRFCDLNGRDLRLCANSPAIDPGCGESYFGSQPPGCPACAPSPSARTSWGAIKTRYR
jgi:hypothetical protein